MVLTLRDRTVICLSGSVMSIFFSVEDYHLHSFVGEDTLRVNGRKRLQSPEKLMWQRLLAQESRNIILPAVGMTDYEDRQFSERPCP